MGAGREPDCCLQPVAALGLPCVGSVPGLTQAAGATGIARGLGTEPQDQPSYFPGMLRSKTWFCSRASAVGTPRPAIQGDSTGRASPPPETSHRLS